MLKPNRTEEWVTRTYPRYIPSEQGGLITYVTMSGMPFSTYADNPSGLAVIGVQLLDVYDFDNPQIQRPPMARNVGDIFSSRTKVLVQGTIETDFLHPDTTGQIAAGVIAYAGPSGLFTHDSSFGGEIVGMFFGDMKVDSHDIMIEGDIYRRQEVVRSLDGTYSTETVGYPRKFVTSPGYVKVRVKLSGSTGNT